MDKDQPQPQSSAPEPVQVTVENFTRAETDRYFAASGGWSLGKLHHYRDVLDINHQTVVRMNRDTLYSTAVFDLDGGPATVTLPDAGGRFMSLQVIDEDEYTHGVFYGAVSRTLAREDIGTRYAMVAIRTFVSPDDPRDVEAVRRLQDAIGVSQPNPGRFEVPVWDKASQERVRYALLELGATLPDGSRMFGAKDEVDPIRHLIGAAGAWGGNPEKDARYLNVYPSLNDGKIVHRLTVMDVPVDGFWSISVYNAEGYFEPNQRNAYSLNNITAAKSRDGSVEVQFGGSADGAPNVLPVMPGWNYVVRLYRPRPEVLDGRWTFPEAQPVH